MGLSFSSDQYGSNEARKKSNVKLQAQQVNAFNGNALKWHAWKKKTRAAIGTAGMLRILDDNTYVTKNKIDNETVFHLLQVATADGTAAHLVDKHEDNRDGQSAYLELVKWYEGDELTTETAEDIRDKLSKISLSTRTHASQYINEFLQYRKHLEDLGESYTVSKTVSIFLKQITDPDYQSTVEVCHINKYDINTCIEQVRAKERRLGRERSLSRRNSVVVRRQNEGPVNHDDPQENIDLEKCKNESGFYAIPREKWQLLSNSDRSFVKSFNGKLRRELEQRNKADERRVVNSRRSNVNIQNNDEAVPPPPKKQRTVTFKNETQSEGQASHGVHDSNSGDKTEVNNKRTVLGFTVKSK